MRTCFGGSSSMIEMRRTRSTSPGQRSSTSAEQARVDLLDDLEMARHDAFAAAQLGQLSSASGISVWLV